MKIIISPAKKMNVDTDTASVRGLPEFLPRTRILMEYMKSLPLERCREIWKCNEKLATLMKESSINICLPMFWRRRSFAIFRNIFGSCPAFTGF